MPNLTLQLHNPSSNYYSPQQKFIATAVHPPPILPTPPTSQIRLIRGRRVFRLPRRLATLFPFELWKKINEKGKGGKWFPQRNGPKFVQNHILRPNLWPKCPRKKRGREGEKGSASAGQIGKEGKIPSDFGIYFVHIFDFLDLGRINNSSNRGINRWAFICRVAACWKTSWRHHALLNHWSFLANPEDTHSCKKVIIK